MKLSNKVITSCVRYRLWDIQPILFWIGIRGRYLIKEVCINSCWYKNLAQSSNLISRGALYSPNLPELLSLCVGVQDSLTYATGSVCKCSNSRPLFSETLPKIAAQKMHNIERYFFTNHQKNKTFQWCSNVFHKIVLISIDFAFILGCSRNGILFFSVIFIWVCC